MRVSLAFIRCCTLARGRPQLCDPSTQVELVPGGREVAVTDANKLAYIHRVADFRLNTQLVGAKWELIQWADRWIACACMQSVHASLR